ncbi:MAG TPA: type II toxin-antitoxin system RelE/ParE family toxin [Pseudolysinimonas sp.]|nr:type II toxin-antitoxin system RelE/ParE family toxin [Pseudolysinimonas sp.]
MTYTILVTPKADKEIRKLDRQVAARIFGFIKTGIDRENPRSKGKMLVNSDMWRYRVGDHRILVNIDDGQVTVLVVKVAHRREVY